MIRPVFLVCAMDHIKCHAKYDKTDNATTKRKHKMAKSRPPSVPNSIVINVLFSLS